MHVWSKMPKNEGFEPKHWLKINFRVPKPKKKLFLCKNTTKKNFFYDEVEFFHFFSIKKIKQDHEDLV